MDEVYNQLLASPVALENLLERDPNSRMLISLIKFAIKKKHIPLCGFVLDTAVDVCIDH